MFTLKCVDQSSILDCNEKRGEELSHGGPEGHYVMCRNRKHDSIDHVDDSIGGCVIR